jgi:hypothetical protein
MNGFRIAALAATILLAACGLTKSPAEGLNFQAPAGWQSTPGIMGKFQMWMTGGGKTQQMLMLIDMGSDTKLNESFDLKDVKGSSPSSFVKNATVVTQRKMTICGNQPAIYIKMRGTSSSSSSEENVELLISKAAQSAYMAAYIYPAALEPNASAEAAIYELCPTKP